MRHRTGLTALRAVPARVGRVPSPGGLDDGLDAGIAGGPAEVALDGLGRGDEHRRVACSPRALDDRDRMAGDRTGGLDHLADAVADAAGDVVDQALRGLDL